MVRPQSNKNILWLPLHTHRPTKAKTNNLTGFNCFDTIWSNKVINSTDRQTNRTFPNKSPQRPIYSLVLKLCISLMADETRSARNNLCGSPIVNKRDLSSGYHNIVTRGIATLSPFYACIILHKASLLNFFRAKKSWRFHRKKPANS